MVEFLHVSTLVHKEKLKSELGTQLKPVSGVFWQDLKQTEGIVKSDEFFPTSLVPHFDLLEQTDVSGEEPLEALAPSPRVVAGALTKGAIEVGKKIKGTPKPKPQTAPLKIPIPPGAGSKTKKKQEKEFLRVYAADDVDAAVSELYGRLVDNMDLLTLSQPAHARRRRIVVASRN